jgi:hypothetical protein
MARLIGNIYSYFTCPTRGQDRSRHRQCHKESLQAKSQELRLVQQVAAGRQGILREFRRLERACSRRLLKQERCSAAR